MMLDILVRWVKTKPSLRRAMADRDWNSIALYYNGSRFSQNHYNSSLKDHYDQLGK